MPWEDEIVLEKCAQLKDAHRAILLNDDHVVDFTAYDQAKRELKEAYKQSQEQYVQEKTHLITAATQQHQSRLAWQTVNEISGRKSTNQGKLRAENPQDRLNKWQQHFEQLLGEPPSVIDVPVETVVDDTLPINTDPFTMDELISVVKTMSCNKATGCDNIPAEVWKSGALNQHLLDICNMALHGDKPSEWSRSVILPFPKKGDLGRASNYRGISLTCISTKIYNKLLLYRIRPHIEPLLRNNQNGFRPNRGTIAQILTLRRIIEGIKVKHLPAILTFVDFRKAFDSIHRGKMLQILLAYGIPQFLVNAIGIMYNDTIAHVKSPDGDTDFFAILAGVLQGDTLAPFLFIIMLDYAMRKAT